MSHPYDPDAPEELEGLEEPQKSKIEETKETVDNAKRSLHQMRRAGTIAANVGRAVAPVLFNPYFWIVSLVALALVVQFTFWYSATKVIGKNQNTCVGTDASFVPDPVSGPIKINANGEGDKQSAYSVVGAWLMKTPQKANGNKPLTKEQAAGIMGNAWQESKYNPAMTQANFGPNFTNEQMLALGNTSGKAIGFFQWDGQDRRTAMVKHAQSKGKDWRDLQSQLEYWQKEFNGPSLEYNLLKKYGFFEPGKTAQEYTLIYEKSFERAGKPAMENRYKEAEEFMKNFAGGGGDIGSMPANGEGSQGCGGGSGLDTSGVVALAISMAWPTREQSLTRSGDPNGCTVVKPEYAEAKKRAEQLGGQDSHSEGGPCAELYASCDRFVATVLKNTVDKDIPWGSTTQQGEYFRGKGSAKWRPYHSKSQAKPGDVWITNSNGHVIIYIGNYKGVDSIAHASFRDRVGAITSAKMMSESMVDNSGRQYTGYTFVG